MTQIRADFCGARRSRPKSRVDEALWRSRKTCPGFFRLAPERPTRGRGGGCFARGLFVGFHQILSFLGRPRIWLLSKDALVN